MARPRVFISSTYYDLKHIRSAMEVFVEGLGYEAVLFESGDIPFKHTEPLDESCYKEIQSCQILVLVIGGRYGSPVSIMDDDEGVDSGGRAKKTSPESKLEKHYEFFNSITRKEFETAQSAGLPVYIFIEKGVSAEYLTYKENRANKTIKYAHVDSVNIFKLLDSIYSLKKNNLVKDFEKFEDISSWLRDQWAGLFADFLTRQSGEATLNSLANQMKSLESVASALKGYSEKLIEQLTPGISHDVIRETNEKIKKDRDFLLFLRNDFVKHLVGAHKANDVALFDLFMNEGDYSKFSKDSQNYLKSKCNAFEGGRAIEEMQKLRAELDLPRFEINEDEIKVRRAAKRSKQKDVGGGKP